jgi:hypothetical protein
MQPSNASRRLIFYPSTLPLRRGFTTHRRTHMRTCSLYRRTCMRAFFSHRRALERTCSPYRRVLVRVYQIHRRALVRACSPHKRALVRACQTHRCTPRARLKFPLTCTNAHLFSGQACTYARLPLNRPRMWAHTLVKIP